MSENKINNYPSSRDYATDSCGWSISKESSRELLNLLVCIMDDPQKRETLDTKFNSAMQNRVPITKHNPRFLFTSKKS